MRVNPAGQIDLYKLAAALRDAGNRRLGQKLDRGVRSAAKTIEDEVFKHTDVYIPRGFERTFRQALKAKREVKLLRGRTVSITFFAMGQKRPRKLELMNAGELEHPVYGRYRRLKSGARMRNPWVARPGQPIRPGVIEEPARRAQPKAVGVLEKAVHELTTELNNVT